MEGVAFELAESRGRRDDVIGHGEGVGSVKSRPLMLLEQNAAAGILAIISGER